MSHSFAFICPVCCSEDSIVASRCTQCKSDIRISAAGIQTQKGEWTFDYYLDWMKKTISVRQDEEILKERLENFQLTLNDPVWRMSQEAVLRQGLIKSNFKSFANLFQRNVLLPKDLHEGLFVICAEYLYFCSSEGNLQFSIEELSCITTNGHYFEFKVKGKPYYQIHFLYESPLKYEILLQNWLSEYYRNKKKQIIEFQPNFRFLLPAVPKDAVNTTPKKMVFPNLILATMKWILVWKIKIVMRFWIRVKIIDLPLLPKWSPYIMILNHQSTFDPFIILSSLDRRIAFLTKSTSFSNPLSRFILYLGKAIPTTRFETDPGVIRHIQKYLESGIPVGIFPEGERCWDGRMQAFKYSVIRLLLKLRIPVVPVVIGGSFEFLPRWERFPRRQDVTLHVLAPFSLINNGKNIRDVREWLEQQFSSKLHQTSD